jgi:hypothetical protein
VVAGLEIGPTLLWATKPLVDSRTTTVSTPFVSPTIDEHAFMKLWCHSWTDFEPRDMSPLGLASEITGQDAAVAPTCGPDAPRPTKKIRRRSKRTRAESPTTSSVSKHSSALADDARGTSDMVMQ